MRGECASSSVPRVGRALNPESTEAPPATPLRWLTRRPAVPTRGPPVPLPSDTRVPDGLDDVATAIGDRTDQTVDELVALTRIPSVSAAGHDPAEVRRSAEHTARLLTEAGLEDVELLEVEDAHPYVTGHWLHAGEDAPTVLLYAHHDVQPVGTPARWTSEPFEPEPCGTGGCTGGARPTTRPACWPTSPRSAGGCEARGHLPVNVKVVVEGEEEIGSPAPAHVPRALRRAARRRRDRAGRLPQLEGRLAGADVVVARPDGRHRHGADHGAAGALGDVGRGGPGCADGDVAAAGQPARRPGPDRGRGVRRRRPAAVGRRAGPAGRAGRRPRRAARRRPHGRGPRAHRRPRRVRARTPVVPAHDHAHRAWTSPTWCTPPTRCSAR